jgi:large subunit ribosomal protein L6
MLEKTIDVPENVEAKLDGRELIVRGPKGELRRMFLYPGIDMKVSGGKITVSTKSKKRNVQAIVGTFVAHARNMLDGVVSGWEARLKVIYSHFPMKLNVDGDKIVVNNFLGGRAERRSAIVGESKVEIQKDEVIVTGIDREDVGQTAANLEQTTRVKGFDRRVFQDGCHLTQKATRMEAEGQKEE